MTSPIENIMIICPTCGKQFSDWWRASMNLKLDAFDDEYIKSATVKTCPHCKAEVKLNALIVDEDGVWRLDVSRTDHAK